MASEVENLKEEVRLLRELVERLLVQGSGASDPKHALPSPKLRARRTMIGMPEGYNGPITPIAL